MKRILVPYDFSETSQQALEKGIFLSLKYKATLVVLHIIEKTFNDEFVGMLWPPKELSSQLKQKIQSEIEKRVPKHSEKIQTEILIQVGRAYVEILRTLEKEKIDLIVIGTHGRTGFKHFRLGSVAEKVVQHSSVPVFIHRGEARAPKRILIPVDFSENSKEGFRLGLKWASDLQSEIYLLHVVGLQDLYSYKDLFLPVEPSLEEALKKEAQEKLKAWSKEIQIPFHQEVRIGNPFLEIKAAIENQNIDLVVLATHGRTGLKHFLMGSIAEQVVRHSPCSVLTIRPAAFVQPAIKFFDNEEAFDEYMKSCN